MSWVDDYLGVGPGWVSTGNYRYEVIPPTFWRGRREVAGKFADWNRLVDKLDDGVDQHRIARRMVGLRNYDIGPVDPDTGRVRFTVGMCALAAHLTTKGLECKVTDGIRHHLAFPWARAVEAAPFSAAVVTVLTELQARLAAQTTSSREAPRKIYR